MRSRPCTLHHLAAPPGHECDSQRSQLCAAPFTLLERGTSQARLCERNCAAHLRSQIAAIALATARPSEVLAAQAEARRAHPDLKATGARAVG
eukprot:10804005-Alexandrium_andersonii.AAC.2